MKNRTAKYASAIAFAFVAATTMRADAATPLQLVSPQFAPGGEIPAAYTCEGKGVSPPLSWLGVPADTKSFALIVDDPDAPDPKAPKRVFVHWVLYNLPAALRTIPEDVRGQSLPAGSAEGMNDWQKTGYGGPCPPIGKHHYVFRLYALDAPLPGLKTPSKTDLERAMQGHVLAKAELIGMYEKKQR